MRTPVLIYQIFYDDSNESEMEKFVESLKTWSKELKFTNKIKFYIVKVQITIDDEVQKNYSAKNSDELGDMFNDLKNDDVYKFDWENIEIIPVKSKN